MILTLSLPRHITIQDILDDAPEAHHDGSDDDEGSTDDSDSSEGSDESSSESETDDDEEGEPHAL